MSALLAPCQSATAPYMLAPYAPRLLATLLRHAEAAASRFACHFTLRHAASFDDDDMLYYAILAATL